MNEARKKSSPQFVTSFAETFGMSPLLATIVLTTICAVVALAIFWFFYSAPPTTITITSGPPGSAFESYAEQYQKILAAEGVKLKILPSNGSQENLQRLDNRRRFRHVDVGFVEVGEKDGATNSKLVSLGSIAYQPLLIFYRAAAPVHWLSEFSGKRLAVGAPGSGTRSFATLLLQTNGVSEADGKTKFLDLDAAAAANALIASNADAVFLMGDSASPKIMRQLLLTPGIKIYNFEQADGYTRRINYLNKLELPMGTVDLGKNIPARDLYLVGPTVELLARPHLHPALSDLLLEAAQEVHGGAKLFQRKGEFPAPLEYDHPVSQDAKRFYTSGKRFLYQHLPFWFASVLNRVLVSFVPLIIVLVPLIRAVPTLYKWRAQLVINKRYRTLLKLEREIDYESRAPVTAERRNELLERLNDIEHAVNKMKVPASFGWLFYSLRETISAVRQRLNSDVK